MSGWTIVCIIGLVFLFCYIIFLIVDDFIDNKVRDKKFKEELELKRQENDQKLKEKDLEIMGKLQRMDKELKNLANNIVPTILELHLNVSENKTWVLINGYLYFGTRKGTKKEILSILIDDLKKGDFRELKYHEDEKFVFITKGIDIWS